MQSCQASPAEYAAYAVGSITSGRRRELVVTPELLLTLPSSIRPIIVRNIAMRMVLEVPNPKLAAALNQLSPLQVDPYFSQWLNVARTYAATSIPELIGIHRQAEIDSKTFRILNMLSTDHLRQVAESGALNSKAQYGLLRGTFSRLFSLGRAEEARQILSRLREMQATLEKSGGIEDAEKIGHDEPSLPVDVAMAFVISRSPTLSNWIGGTYASYSPNYDIGIDYFDRWFSRELPPAFVTGEAIQSDIETWLMLPHRWYRFYGTHGFSWDALDRYNANSRTRHRMNDLRYRTPAFFSKEPGKVYYGLQKLVAFDELAVLQGEQRLIRQASLTLLRWAEGNADGWLKSMFSKRNLTAEALHRVVMLNRYETGGDINGVPLGKRAFQLLHKYYRDTEWAKKTPHWYNGRQVATEQ